MIYLDSSVALSALLSEPRAPPRSFWSNSLISSRLLEYETMNRVYARAVRVPGVAAARELLDSLDFVELTPTILARALAPFPIPVRTLDGLHLATLVHLRARGRPVRLATYDVRLGDAAAALGIPLEPL